MLEGFDFATPSIAKHLTGTLAPLKSYNGLTVPVEYFDEAMSRCVLSTSMSRSRRFCIRHLRPRARRRQCSEWPPRRH